MKDKIIANLSDPEGLEVLYRSDRTGFRKAITEIRNEYPDNLLVRAWNLRLVEDRAEVSFGSRKDFFVLLILSLISGTLIKWPDWAGLDLEAFYVRNLGFLVFPFLGAYFLFRQKVSSKGYVMLGLAAVLPAVYTNTLPQADKSDVLILVCLHAFLLMWAITGFAFTGFNRNDLPGRVRFLRMNGDLFIVGGVMFIAVAILGGITIALFNLIGSDIRDVFGRNILVYEFVISFFISAGLVLRNPQLVDRVSPVVARLFSPLVLVTLVVYFIAMLSSGKDPYNDREFLFSFNVLLVGVLAIILFAVAGTSGGRMRPWEDVVLLLLSLVTVALNLIALSAILFRISEWGITPNRAAVMGSNLLVLSNLLIVSSRLWHLVKRKGDRSEVEVSIARFMPFYMAWALFVMALFPVIFN